MIYAPTTFSTRSSTMDLATGVNIAEDGQAFVAVQDVSRGGLVVQPSTGAAGEVFAGFSDLQTSAVVADVTSTVKVEVLQASAAGVVTVSKTPVAGTVSVSDATTGATITINALAGSNVDLTAANANKIVTVIYRTTLNAAQARALNGDRQPGGFAGQSYFGGKVSLSHDGVIYTNCFDSSKNFAAATALKLGANGQVTDQSGSGVTIVGAQIERLPSVDFPFLGIRFSAQF